MIEEVEFVTCPHCGEEQPDFGANTKCECCGYAPMPFHDPQSGELIEQ